MDPKATIPNPLSTRFVATWPEDCSGWQIERHSAEGGGLPHVSAEEYFAGLPSPLPSPALASFLACPGPMAVAARNRTVADAQSRVVSGAD